MASSNLRAADQFNHAWEQQVVLQNAHTFE